MPEPQEVFARESQPPVNGTGSRSVTRSTDGINLRLSNVHFDERRVLTDIGPRGVIDRIFERVGLHLIVSVDTVNEHQVTLEIKPRETSEPRCKVLFVGESEIIRPALKNLKVFGIPDDRVRRVGRVGQLE